MEKYLNASIKEIIREFPGVGKILEEYNIGCVPCALGSCILKDVVTIHNLSTEQEAQLMYRIEKAIYPERDVKEPEGKSLARKAPSKKVQYSPPIKRLVDEHVVIMKWLELLPGVLEKIDIGSKEDRQWISDSLDFIRLYADKFHHAKEEDILFEYAEKNLDIIKVILQDHETARGHVEAISEAMTGNDGEAVVRHLSAYGDLLREHIKKEDEILYPWIDRNLSTRQVGELFAKFDEVEARMDKEMIDRCEKFARAAGDKVQKTEKKETAK